VSGKKNDFHNICLSKRIDTKRSAVAAKVQLFREDHKNLHNLPHGFDVY
jgi:hypothetical protein